MESWNKLSTVINYYLVPSLSSISSHVIQILSFNLQTRRKKRVRRPTHYYLMKRVRRRTSSKPKKATSSSHRCEYTREHPLYFIKPSSSSSLVHRGSSSSINFISSVIKSATCLSPHQWSHQLFTFIPSIFNIISCSFQNFISFISSFIFSAWSYVFHCKLGTTKTWFHFNWDFWDNVHHNHDISSPQEKQAVAPSDIEGLCSRIDVLQLHRLSTLLSPLHSDGEIHWMNLVQKERKRLSHILFTSNDPSVGVPSYLGPSCIFTSALDEQIVPIVIDTGASTGLTPFKKDFISYRTIHHKVTGVSAQSDVIGVGVVRWDIIDQKGKKSSIECEAYHCPSALIRLYSPQAHFQEHGSGSLYLDHKECRLRLPHSTKNSTLSFPFNHFNGLPLMIKAPSDAAASTALVLEEDLSGSLHQIYTATTKNTAPFEATMYPSVGRSVILDAIDQQYCSAVVDSGNTNLRSAQIELLKWHFKLGHINMHQIQRLMCHSKPFDNHNSNGNITHPRIIPTKYKSTATCEVPKCAACILGKMERIPKSTTRTHPSTNGKLSEGALCPGDRISMDQYVVTQKGRTLRNSSRDSMKYNGGTIFVDHASGKVFNYCQISLRSGETLMGKRILEHDAADHNIVLRNFQADNGVFASEEFRNDLKVKRQKLRFCGVGAHHQNGTAERFIKTICYLTRAQLIHAAICWPNQADLELWPFAFDHSVYLWNNMPSKDGFTPEEKWAGVKEKGFSHLRRLHPWGCPAYVLDPRLQDDKKIPKFLPRARQGVFLGYSKEHATNVGLILNPETKRISPQFHVLYDDWFTTVRSVDEADTPDLATFDWASLIRRSGGTEQVFDGEVGGFLPPLDDEWITPEERTHRERVAPSTPPTDVPPSDPPNHGPAQPQPTTHQRENRNTVTQATEDDQQVGFDLNDNNFPPLPSQESTVQQREQSSAQQREQSSAQQREHPPSNTPFEPPSTPNDTPSVGSDPTSSPLPRRSKRQRRLNPKYFGDDFQNLSQDGSIDLSRLKAYHTMHRAEQELRRKETKLDHHLEYLQTLDWDTSFNALTSSASSSQSKEFFANLSKYEDPITGSLLESHPLILAAKSGDNDNPRWHQATSGENAEGFWKAMWKEVMTLQDIDVWDQVPREQVHQPIVKSTWAFKVKRFPSGLVRKLKSRFCVRGDTQTEGVDYFESFAPVVSWTTVRLLLILSVMLDLKTSQVDYVAAFCQAPMKDDVYIELPQGWQRLNDMGLTTPFKPGHVLKLKRSLYGLVQSPVNFFRHLKGNLEKVGFKQSTNDPCLFISETVICLVYVDDCLFFSKNQSDIDDAIQRIRDQGMDLNKEDDAAGFLGVNINKRDDGNIELLQTGLINRVIEAAGVSDANPKSTPAPKEALGRDLNGAPFDDSFNYASVVGMMLYLCNNSRPDIAFAVSQCARYTHHPTALHANYLKHIAKYLKATRDKGLILNPKGNPLDINCFVDADFAGLWNIKDESDPHCVRSRSGWVVTIGGCPIVWKSKLIAEICLSTMESEYISLSKACKDLLPIQRVVTEVGIALGLEKGAVTNIRSTIWEDNQAALKLANKELPYMTNRSKHIAIKYHWFRSHVGIDWVVNPISTSDQIADIFTKGLSRDTFEKLRFLLMGW